MPVTEPVIVGASGATLRTADGRELIDCASAAFGYQYPAVREAVSAQLSVLPQSTRMFLNRPLADLVCRLAESTPGDLAVTYPANSAAEAMEGALKLALGYHRRSGRGGFVATLGSDHGGSGGAMSVSRLGSPEAAAPPGAPIDVAFVRFGDTPGLRRAVETTRPAAVVLEPIATGEGLTVPPAGYLSAVREICDESGALLIVNETITGLGRTGARFAVDAENVVPDILVLGGALGGGVLPVGAYVTTAAINRRVYGRRGPWLHGSTTGGNPLACVAAVSVLDAMDRENLSSRSRISGRRIRQSLSDIHLRNPDVVRSIVSVGQLAAITFHGPAAARCAAARARAHGVLAWEGALERGVLGLRPPLICTGAELERALEGIRAAVDAVGAVAQERIA